MMYETTQKGPTPNPGEHLQYSVAYCCITYCYFCHFDFDLVRAVNSEQLERDSVVKCLTCAILEDQLWNSLETAILIQTCCLEKLKNCWKEHKGTKKSFWRLDSEICSIAEWLPVFRNSFIPIVLLTVGFIKLSRRPSCACFKSL